MVIHTHLQTQDVRAIARDYGLEVTDFAPLAGGATNSNYRLDTRRGSYVLTLFDSSPKEDAVCQGRLLPLLADHGFPTSRLLPTVHGRALTEHRGKPVMLKVYIPGRVVHDLGRGMLRQIGVALARLHQVPAPDFLAGRQPYGLSEVSRVIGQNVDPAYETWLAGHLPRLRRGIPQALPVGLIHGDLFYDNVLFAGRQLVAIIDFECALRYYKAYDLAMGLVGLCNAKSRLDLNKAQALVAGYQRVRQLQEGERVALQGLTGYAASLVSCWRFWEYHLARPNPRMAGKHRQMARLARAIDRFPPARFRRAVLDAGKAATGLPSPAG